MKDALARRPSVKAKVVCDSCCLGGALCYVNCCFPQHDDDISIDEIDSNYRPFYHKKRWISVSCFLLCCLVGVGIYLLYQKLNVPKKQEEILNRYGTMFRTKQEQRIFELEMRDKLSPIHEIVPETKACVFTCTAIPYGRQPGWHVSVARMQEKVRVQLQNMSSSPPSPYETIFARSPSSSSSLSSPSSPSSSSSSTTTSSSPSSSASLSSMVEPTPVAHATSQIEYFYHGCCISHTEFFSPGRLKNQHDQWRRVVQFRNRRQYFARDICRQADACSGCTCSSTVTYNTAVVVDYVGEDGDDWDTQDNIGRVMEGEGEVEHYRLEMVKMNGSCKCFNS